MSRARSSTRRADPQPVGFDFDSLPRPTAPAQRSVPAAQQPAPPPQQAPSPARAEASSVRLRLPWYACCARCGVEATLGEMLFDRAGTGPWLCHPSSYSGRPGCRPRLAKVTP